MKTKQIIELGKKYVMPTYKRNPVVLVKGKGSYIWDLDGRKLLDFFSGWGVSGLGYCHPAVVKAIKRQSEILLHVPNNYYNILQMQLAKMLVEESFKGKVFFCNSGAEANEAAIKLARKWGSDKGKYEIISMLNSFHGRTMGAITATGQEKYHKGFKPLVPGFKHVPFNDLAAIKKAVNSKTCAIMLEVIQGEGGINIASCEYIGTLVKLAKKHKLLIIVDEVQTGIGRTGKMFAYQHYAFKPDIITLAKTLGGGMPIGAMIAEDKISTVLGPATHASTFGGSPIACAASIAVLETIKKDKLIDNVNRMGKYLENKLVILKEKYPVIKNIKGKGLMRGIELGTEGEIYFQKCLAEGLLINCTQGNILRFLPAMTVTRQEIDQAIAILDKVLEKEKKN
jgi:acetylornithine/N-succinyldiaminopimelate aminotransferase